MNKSDKVLIMMTVTGGSLKDVQLVLEKHKLIKDEGFFDYRILKAALTRRQYDPVIEFLIKKDHCRVRNPNEKQDTTPLHLAIKFLNADIANVLLDKGASIYDKNLENETVLYAAFKEGFLSATDILLNYCGTKDLNPKDEDDIVHFNIACVRRHLSAIKLYLKNGFDINCPLNLNSSKHIDINPKSYENKKMYFILDDEKWPYYNKCYSSYLCYDEWISLDYYLTAVGTQRHDFFRCYERQIICTVYPGYTPLHFAVKYAFEEFVKFLLTLGADCNKKDADGRTPLHLACQVLYYNRTKIVDTLFDYETCPHVQDNNGLTSMHTAFYNKNREKENIFNILLSKVQWGLTNYTDKNCLSYFHMACATSNISAINDFLNSGVSIDDRVVSGEYKGYRALHIAVLHNQKEVVELLLQRRANINVKTSDGFTPLHIACGYFYEKFSELMYDSGNPRNDSWTSNRSDQLDIIKLLIAHGADVDVKDNSGRSPLYHACKFFGNMRTKFFQKFLISEISTRMEEIIKIFLSRKENGSAHKINPSSILHILSENHSFPKVTDKLIEFLLNEGADLCAFDDTGLTPLHIAVRSCNISLVQSFLKYNANVNAKSKNSMIPLQILVQNLRGHRPKNPHEEDIVCMLLESGSDVNAINEYGMTMLHDAIDKTRVRVVEKLLQYGADINLLENLSCFTSTISDYGMNLSRIDETSINLFKIIFTHVQKLLVLGLHVSDKIQKNCDYLYSCFKLSAVSLTDLDNISDKCMEELNFMKLEKITSNTSLYSILLKDPHDLSKFVKNSNLLKIVVHESLETMFLYGYLLKIQYKKAIVRRDVLKSAIASLNRITGFSLPDSCCDVVLKNLTNEEIVNLKSAAFIKD